MTSSRSHRKLRPGRMPARRIADPGADDTRFGGCPVSPRLAAGPGDASLFALREGSEPRWRPAETACRLPQGDPCGSTDGALKLACRANLGPHRLARWVEWADGRPGRDASRAVTGRRGAAWYRTKPHKPPRSLRRCRGHSRLTVALSGAGGEVMARLLGCCSRSTDPQRVRPRMRCVAWIGPGSSVETFQHRIAAVRDASLPMTG
jgi:hypothetical protein